MGGHRTLCPLERPVLGSGATGDRALRALGPGQPSFQSQPRCLRAGELGQVSSRLCASVSSLKQRTPCADNTEQYRKGLAWYPAHCNCSLIAFTSPSPLSSLSPASPALVPSAGSVPPSSRALAPCHQAHCASCSTGAVTPSRKSTVNRWPGPWARPSLDCAHSQIFKKASTSCPGS